MSLNPQILQRLDREAQATYSLRVKAEDDGSPRKSTTVDYTVVVDDANDNSPQFVADQRTAIDIGEDEDPGKALLTILATDADTGIVASRGGVTVMQCLFIWY